MNDLEREGQRRAPTIGEGVRSGVGVLVALKEAIEETIQEAHERGDLSPARAREFLGSALHRAQDAAGEVRERLDLVPRRDFDLLRAEVEALRARLDELESRARRLLPLPPVTEEADPAGPTETRMP
jgi:polyhydroxyalkanoate synthesis regulator phasin